MGLPCQGPGVHGRGLTSETCEAVPELTLDRPYKAYSIRNAIHIILKQNGNNNNLCEKWHLAKFLNISSNICISCNIQCSPGGQLQFGSFPRLMRWGMGAYSNSSVVDKQRKGKQIQWICQTKTNWFDKLGNSPLPSASDGAGLLSHWSNGRAKDGDVRDLWWMSTWMMKGKVGVFGKSSTLLIFSAFERGDNESSYHVVMTVAQRSTQHLSIIQLHVSCESSQWWCD